MTRFRRAPAIPAQPGRPIHVASGNAAKKTTKDPSLPKRDRRILSAFYTVFITAVCNRRRICMPWHMPGVFWHTLWHTPKIICKLDYALLQNQYSFAPAGMWGSTIRRWSFSSSPSLWMAESSMPQDSMPIMGLGGRLVMAMQVLPMSCSGS